MAVPRIRDRNWRVVAFCTLPLHLALLTASPVLAQGASQGSITLRASVPAICSIGISNNSATLNITGGQSNFAVATVEERCNAASGYTVSLSSKNGGQLSTGTAGVAYTMQYGDSAGSGGAISADRAVSGDTRQTVLSVSVPASPTAVAGDYEDTVTISIAAK